MILVPLGHVPAFVFVDGGGHMIEKRREREEQLHADLTLWDEQLEGKWVRHFVGLVNKLDLHRLCINGI